MKTKLCLSLFVLSVFSSHNVWAQQPSEAQKLDSITITSTAIELPFKKNSRTITIISSKVIKQSPATNLAELLQQEAGIDVRRQGVNGMQADLYIRGGSFDQTLLLIDGIKVEDPQTGHHTLNMALPLEVIERVEIIKGPAARVFGQNAFTGAINIVTKSNADAVNSVGYKTGSYNQQQASGTLGTNLKNTTLIGHASLNTSDGYRHNTDFENQNYFVKGRFNTTTNPIDVIGYFAKRDFGANQFYAVESGSDQYEETQSSLVGASTKFKTENFKITPRIYWKRTQDMYLYVREDPSVYRNLHLSNKVGVQVNASYTSSAGITGFGIDAAKVFMTSTNLGERDRLMANLFVEHRFSLVDNTLDITPGVSVNYFSDFKFHAFPGVDVGYSIDDVFKAYANVGYTYRVPTYTDLYYVGRTDLGNANLEPEKALSGEIGVRYFGVNVNAYIAVFNRSSNNLIDYTKENVDDKWLATNLKSLTSTGVELNLSSSFKSGLYTQNISLGYTYLDENLNDIKTAYSKYVLNALTHHFTATVRSKFLKNVSQSIVYKFAERASGTSYSVVDVKATLKLSDLELSVIGNNILNTEYVETGFVPMPKGNILLGVNYAF
ncbi:TonB-dependent receptor [Formosa sp. Hel1_33_131]|uniref:TonB-dependent receptor plug domain-containing protein n=1 Tax=Formosa sp. Hel1_33_131 TaxID=1336794 RepID=UPI00084E25A7|nr:TonB-dependent receptor [Formosa sp. Hel1_33_131]AOR28162.1 TonB-dependent receptor [Formosa sp. Hel1_33_131]